MSKISKNPVATDAEKTALLFMIEEQKNLIAKQSEIIAGQSETIAKQSETIARQEQTIKLLQKAVFGQKSEKIIDIDERQGCSRIF